MVCKANFKDLSRYIDGAQDMRQKEIIESHLKVCPDCRKTLEGLSLLKQSLSEMPIVKESQDFDFVFNQKLNERLQKETITWQIKDIFTSRVPVLVRVAALLILSISVTLGSYNYYIYNQLPFVETVNGDARLYKAGSQSWIALAPNARLKENDRIESAQGAIINIIARGKYAARIKEASDIRIAKLDVGHKNHFTEFDIKYGKLLVNTKETFKGSTMTLKSPSCQARVVGTAFAIDVDKPSSGNTWLGVLEGKVKVTSQGEDVYVSAGQKTEVKLSDVPDAPTLLSDDEWNFIQELYQLGEKPQVVLLVSTRENRVDELLKPAPLYILDTSPRTIPRELEAIINIINKAIEQNDIETHKFAIERLQALVQKHPNPKYNPQFIMFIGSYYYYIGDYEKAVESFDRIVSEYPDYVLSSLAQRAIIEIYKNNLNDKDKANEAIKKLLQKYPDSVDSKKFME